MQSDATTLPLPEPSVGGSLAGRRRRSHSPVGTLAGANARVVAGAAALAAIFLLSLFLVVMAANRPSGLSPTTHTNFFPGWMAGPLGGLWPGMPSDSTTIRWMFTAGI